MAYVPTYTPNNPPKLDVPAGTYSSFFDQTPASNPYGGYTDQMAGLMRQLYGQAQGVWNQAQQTPTMQQLPQYQGTPNAQNAFGNLQQYGYPTQAPTARDAKPFMDQLLGGQRDQMDSLVKRMAGAGIKRGGMNVQGGAPLESSLYQQGIKQLGQGYADRYSQGMGLAQNAANYNRQSALDRMGQAQTAAQWNRQGAQDKYNAGVQQAQYANQQAQGNQQNLQQLYQMLMGLGNQAAGANFQGTQAAANADQTRQGQERQSYNQDITNWNKWRGLL